MWALAAAFALAFVTPAVAQPAAATADQVKAAYLHKFAGYVDWPAQAFADPAAPFVIGVVGAGNVREELTRLVAGRTVLGRAIEVRRLPAAGPEKDVQVVFIGSDVGAEATAELLAAYRGRPVLTVTNATRGLDAGAALNFVERDRRVRFEAAPAAAELGGLHLSSRLLAVADRVVGSAP
jgi:hypothetical protein